MAGPSGGDRTTWSTRDAQKSGGSPNFPEAGITSVRCFLVLSNLPSPYVAGVLTTNTVASRKPLGDESDPPGYTQPSIATIRLWRKRNLARFPADFLFRLRASEVDAINRSQSATGSQKHRDPRFPPYAFTEHGAIMAATVLNSRRAVEMSVYVVRAFVKLRELLASNRQLSQKLTELERKLHTHDRAILEILAAIRRLARPPLPKHRGIGFTPDLGGDRSQ